MAASGQARSSGSIRKTAVNRGSGVTPFSHRSRSASSKTGLVIVIDSTFASSITRSMYWLGSCSLNHLRALSSLRSDTSSPSFWSVVSTPRQASEMGDRSTNRCFQM